MQAVLKVLKARVQGSEYSRNIYFINQLLLIGWIFNGIFLHKQLFVMILFHFLIEYSGNILQVIPPPKQNIPKPHVKLAYSFYLLSFLKICKLATSQDEKGAFYLWWLMKGPAESFLRGLSIGWEKRFHFDGGVLSLILLGKEWWSHLIMQMWSTRTIQPWQKDQRQNHFKLYLGSLDLNIGFEAASWSYMKERGLC